MMMHNPNPIPRVPVPATCYIAGKMAGLPDKGRRMFHQAEEVLQELGWQVLNPARLPDNLTDNKYMPICLAMLSAADTVMLLPGWENSRGARLEAQYAVYQHMPVVVVESLIPFRAAPLRSMVWY
ncbi:MAG: DUF4406 domain-containing protein [Aristaeellaceae bacterium]